MRKIKRENYLDTKTQFKEAIVYLKESSLYIYSSILIFIFSAAIGFFQHESFLFIDKILEEIMQKTEGLNMYEMIFFILQNNLQSALYSIILGVFLGIFPLISSLVNGVVIGYVLQKVYVIAGLAEWWRLLPHGIFELPAIFISFGLGIRLGFSIFSKKPKIREFKRRFYNSANTFLMIIIPLLIIAAIIEGILIGLAE